jgi:hypothetical protein
MEQIVEFVESIVLDLSAHQLANSSSYLLRYQGVLLKDLSQGSYRKEC